MRCLLRNKQTVYYSLVESITDITDSYGNRTGQYRITYSSPVAIQANVGWQTGIVTSEPYGISSEPQRRIIHDNPNLPIVKDAILWVDCVPDANGEDGTVKHDYVVSGDPQRSLNNIVIPITEVNVH